MTDLIDRAALVDFMDRVYRAMEADMLAADNAAYLRGYKAALEEVRKATSVHQIWDEVGCRWIVAAKGATT